MLTLSRLLAVVALLASACGDPGPGPENDAGPDADSGPEAGPSCTDGPAPDGGVEGNAGMIEGATSFDLDIELYENREGCDEPQLEDTIDAWLTLTPIDAQSGLAVVSAFGRAAEGTYTREGESVVNVSFPDDEDACEQLRGRLFSVPYVYSYRSMRLVVRDDDGDGLIDLLSAEADVRRRPSDSGDGTPLHGRAEGRLDRTNLIGSYGDVSPFGPIRVYAHVPTTTPTLAFFTESGMLIEDDACEADDRGWLCTPTSPLAWNTPYVIGPSDGDARVRVVTADEPGLFTSPDFEDYTPFAGWGAGIVEAQSFGRPVEGRGLSIGAGGAFIARMDTSSDALSLRLRYHYAPGRILHITFFDAEAQYEVTLPAPAPAEFTEVWLDSPLTEVIAHTIPIPDALARPFTIRLRLDDDALDACHGESEGGFVVIETLGPAASE